MIHAREDYNRIQDPAGLIPENEPVFLMRGHDPCAIGALTKWIEDAERLGVEKRMIDAAREQRLKMAQWQIDVKKKVPDMPL